MKTRAFVSEDFPTLESWWSVWHKTKMVFDRPTFPKIGLVVTDNDNKTMFCMGFIYRTDTSLCLIEWVTANPSVEKPIRNEALDILIGELKAKAAAMGFTAAFTSLVSKSLIERMERQGFAQTDVGVTNMIGRLRACH